MKDSFSEPFKVSVSVSVAFQDFDFVVTSLSKTVGYGASKEFSMPVRQLTSVFEHSQYSGILLFCAANIQSDISFLAASLSVDSIIL